MFSRLIIFFVFFASYLFTLCPGLPPRDSGELITTAASLGIAHAPGYPVYVLLGRIFSLVPLANIGYRLNLMSCFFAAISLVLIYEMLRKLFSGGTFIAGLVSVLIFGLSASFWKEANSAEVFSLNTFFIVLLFLSMSRLYLFSFLLGLGLGNHHTLFLILPGVLYLIFNRSVHRWNYRLPIMAFFFILGLSVYFYLPLRSLQKPDLNLGNPENLTNFVNVLLRKDYGTLKLSSETGEKKKFRTVLFSIERFLFSDLQATAEMVGNHPYDTGCGNFQGKDSFPSDFFVFRTVLYLHS